MRFSLPLALLALGAAAALAATDTPHFALAEIQISPREARPMTQGPFFTAGRYEVRQASMLDLIRIAYGVDPERINGGPSWLEMDRFDVFAKTAGASNAPSRALMLRALLAERFHLVVHNDSKPTAAFALTVGKKPLMKAADDPPGDTGCKFDVQNAPQGPPAPNQPITLPVLLYTCHNTTMAAFASGMLDIPGAAQYFNSRPVVDQTKLEGAWDFTLKYTPKLPAGLNVTGESMPLFESVEKQLGLKLEATTVPLPVIVVDSVDEKPTPNTAEADKAFPAPTEFEVAELKPSDPSATGGRGAARAEIKNGRVFVPNIPLKNLMELAWDLDSDEMLVGAPKWMEDRFDLIAKAPPGVALGDLTPQRSSVSVNIDALRPMLRALMVEQFKLAVHTEERPVNTYTLTALKPKLTKADPSSRTKWEEGVDPGSKNGKNANPTLGRLVTCHNMTMAQFAQLLPGIAPGYLRTKVVDATGLEGGWDFTFSFSPAGVLQMGGGGRGGDGGRAGDGGASPGTTPEASEPSGGLSLFDAMVKELGLKLEMQKRPLAVVVIDHVERKTEN
ncbi:MAG TPA: TIGR03435 family protein [Bryobacteraceae bacterium]|nr:TIGR03435 family protein [Bryobacteraceae bacterium]